MVEHLLQAAVAQPLFNAGETNMACDPQIVGALPLRKEGRAKVRGEARYIDDLALSTRLHLGKTIRAWQMAG